MARINTNNSKKSTTEEELDCKDFLEEVDSVLTTMARIDTNNSKKSTTEDELDCKFFFEKADSVLTEMARINIKILRKVQPKKNWTIKIFPRS